MRKPTPGHFHLLRAVDGLVMSLAGTRKGTKKHSAICAAIFLLRPHAKRKPVPDVIKALVRESRRERR